MSVATFDVFAGMLPTLTAEERLAHITDTAAGSGMMKRSREHVNELRRTMNRRRKPQRGSTAGIAAMGIGVKRG